jgi:endonuclease-3
MNERPKNQPPLLIEERGETFMPAVTNKQRVLNQILHVWKKAGEPEPPRELPVLEQFIYALCREGTTRDMADQAFGNLRERFFDWNEIRVSSARELEEVFADLPDSESRAVRLISFLQEVFETTFSFDLESLHKKGLKQSAKQLSRYQASSDFVVAWVLRQSLGGHSVPIDAPTLRVTRRLGLIESDQESAEAARASLEHLVPKARGMAFGEAVSKIAADVCLEEEPNCPACPLHSDCPTGQENIRYASSRSSRVKPR